MDPQDYKNLGRVVKESGIKPSGHLTNEERKAVRKFRDLAIEMRKNESINAELNGVKMGVSIRKITSTGQYAQCGNTASILDESGEVILELPGSEPFVASVEAYQTVNEHTEEARLEAAIGVSYEEKDEDGPKEKKEIEDGVGDTPDTPPDLKEISSGVGDTDGYENSYTTSKPK